MPARRPGDLAYAFGGWYLLAFAPAAGLVELLAPDVGAGEPAFLLAGLLALPLAVVHWRERRSLAPLGAMFFWTMALAVTAGLPLAFLLDAFAVGGGLGEPTVRLGFLGVLYAGAYVVGVRRVGRPLPGDSRRRGDAGRRTDSRRPTDSRPHAESRRHVESRRQADGGPPERGR